jgi:hypothetical protein
VTGRRGVPFNATADRVARGDVIVIGGQAFTVKDVTPTADGRAIVAFTTGEQLIMLRHTRIAALRPAGGAR